MARCNECGGDKKTIAGCSEKFRLVKINGREYERITWAGSESICDDIQMLLSEDRCPDCHCMVGQFHHFGCDMEECPHCGRQLIGYGCVD